MFEADDWGEYARRVLEREGSPLYRAEQTPPATEGPVKRDAFGRRIRTPNTPAPEEPTSRAWFL